MKETTRVPGFRRATDAEIATARAWVDQYVWNDPADRQAEYERALEIVIFANGGRHQPPVTHTHCRPKRCETCGVVTVCDSKPCACDSEYPARTGSVSLPTVQVTVAEIADPGVMAADEAHPGWWRVVDLDELRATITDHRLADAWAEVVEARRTREAAQP